MACDMTAHGVWRTPVVLIRHGTSPGFMRRTRLRCRLRVLYTPRPLRTHAARASTWRPPTPTPTFPTPAHLFTTRMVHLPFHQHHSNPVPTIIPGGRAACRFRRAPTSDISLHRDLDVASRPPTSKHLCTGISAPPSALYSGVDVGRWDAPPVALVCQVTDADSDMPLPTRHGVISVRAWWTDGVSAATMPHQH